MSNTQQVLRLAGADGFVAPARRIEDLPGPSGLPLLGNSHQLSQAGMHASLEQWARQYGPMFRFKFGSRSVVGISEPGLINELLRHRPKESSRSPRVTALINELGPQGLFTAEGDAWRRQRKLVMRALTPEAVGRFFPIITTVTQRLEARWRAAALAGRAINASRDLKRYSIDVTTWLAMGVDVDTLTHDDNPLQEDVEFFFSTVGRRLPRLFPYWRYLKMPIDRRTDAVMARLGATVAKLIADARANIAANPEIRAKPRNILEALIVARDEPGSEFTDDDVKGNVATMLFAGEDTTANAMAWLLYHLSIHPEAAERVTGEADAVLGGHPIPTLFGSLEKLEYIEAAAVESMRLKPIAPFQGQLAKVPMDLAGLRVDAGQLLFLMYRIVGTDEKHFSEPMRYLPERWLENGGERADDTRRKVFPFGGGPRYCPGRYLAMVELKMVTSMACHNFALALDVDASEIGEHFSFTLGPEILPIRLSVR